MADRMAATKRAKRPAKSTGKPRGALTAEEKAALRDLTEERKGKGVGEGAVLARIVAMPQPDRALAQRIHDIVRSSAPALSPKTWYGMPAYANQDGKVVCFFQDAAKFKARYATFGFTGAAKLDDGNVWPTSFAFTKLTAADEARFAALVKKAAR